jgi:hypothetical protein
MESTNTQNTEAEHPVPYQSRVDSRPLTAREMTLWWVMGAMGLFSMLLLIVLMALMHTPMASN